MAGPGASTTMLALARHESPTASSATVGTRIATSSRPSPTGPGDGSHPCRSSAGRLKPNPGRQWARWPPAAGAARRPDAFVGGPLSLGPRVSATLLAAYDLSTDRLYGHIKTHKCRTEFLAFLRYLRRLYPLEVGRTIVLDKLRAPPDAQGQPKRPAGADLHRGQQHRAGLRPLLRKLLNRTEARFTALRYFALDGTDHDSHQVLGRMIRRYIAWRNRHARDAKLQEVIKRANVA